jgi:hypothetical protein
MSAPTFDEEDRELAPPEEFGALGPDAALRRRVSMVRRVYALLYTCE